MGILSSTCVVLEWRRQLYVVGLFIAGKAPKHDPVLLWCIQRSMHAHGLLALLLWYNSIVLQLLMLLTTHFLLWKGAIIQLWKHTIVKSGML